MIALELLRRYWLPIAGAVVLAASHLWVYQHGKSVERAPWESRWVQRDMDDATAQASAEQAARLTEQANQAAMNKVQADATQRLEQARTDAAGANSAADRLRDQVGKLLAADQAASTSGTCPGRSTTRNPGNLLAVVLDKSVQRNRELAAFADLALNAASSCAAGYDAVRHPAPPDTTSK